MVRIPRLGGTTAYLAAWLTPGRPYRIRAGPRNLLFHCHYRDGLARQMAKYGEYETAITQWISDRLARSPPCIVLDVGAHIGWHAMHAAQHASVEFVVAFEPNALNALLLDRNLTANAIDNVVTINSAVGAKGGIARLFHYKNSNAGRHSVITDYGLGSRSVPLIDLDAAVANLGLGERRVGILKIDVEGNEPAVIAGASATLDRTDAIVLEYTPNLSEGAGLSVDGMLAELFDRGFKPFVLGRRVRAIGLDDLKRFKGQTDLGWVRD